jgi:N-acetylmuramoyl-L-alanine amidase
VPAITVCVAAVLALVVLIAPVAAMEAATGALGLTLDLRGSPIRSDGSGPGVTARVGIDAAARLRVVVTDFDGRLVRELFEGDRRPGQLVRSWRGRDDDGEVVPPGPYRVVATATSAEAAPDAADASAADAPTVADRERAQGWVTVAARPIYPAAPGSITIAVDPGHGGSLDGAVADDGTREADLNLDIGLRLARMLEGAGVDVVLTRSSDADVNTPPLDRTADGVVDETDELAARPDIANAARADLFISVHNNIAVNRWVGGPSTYFYDQRTFGERSQRLARTIQERMVAALEAFAGGGWQPYDHGALIYPYYVLRDYDPPRLLRPTQMPGVLSEGLFLSNPRELRLLKQRRVRQAMANAYYEAIARYLARRGHHVGYALESVPPVTPAAAPLRLRVEVRNQGTRPMRGWRLSAGALPAGSAAAGRARPGSALGGRRIPPLAPGQSRWLTLDLTAPASAGDWVVAVDAIDREGRRASRSGSPMLQVPLTTLAPPPTPSPPIPSPPMPSPPAPARPPSAAPATSSPPPPA